MKTPPFLIGASLVFWGWQTGLWPLGVALAMIAEGSRLVRSKWDLKPADYNRLADLCTLLFVALLVYFYVTRRSAALILVLIQWLPVTFLPILVAQVYGASDRIDITALFLTLRKRRKGGKQADARPMALNLTYPYLGTCILSASAANWRTPWFYAGLFLLASWALWPLRSRRYPPVAWAGLLASIGVMGYVGQIGLNQLQLLLEDKALDWFADYGRKDADPYRARTSIGDIGSLKPSDRVLFRVDGDLGPASSVLLREATYNAYTSSAWFAQHSVFRTLPPGGDGAQWKAGESQGPGRGLTVHVPLKGGKGMLKLPMGAYWIRGPEALKVTGNQYGAVRAEEGPGMLSYRVEFRGRGSLDSPPDKNDLIIPDREREGISRVAEALNLPGRSPKETLGIIRAFFLQEFTYSLTLGSGEGPMTPIGDFLERSRTGHCEYFATASVLLLRASGIPARYATGYSVHEFSDTEKKFLVREKHAHAWALAHVDGTWQEVDTTPASWMDMERETASSLRSFYDLWSWGMFRLSVWRWQEGNQGKGWVRHLVWLLILPIFFLARRLRTRGRSMREKEAEKGKQMPAIRPGLDSAFYLIERRLAELGYPRQPWETISSWMQRIEASRPAQITREVLDSILTLHYRYRFDPRGLSPDERRLLDSRAGSWLEQHRHIA